MSKSKTSSEVLVVGAGAAGMASAIALARAGVRVTLLERGEAGREASWAGGGILSPLPHWNFREEVTRLTMRGEALWPEWADYLQASTGVDTEYRKCGMMILPDYDEEKGLRWCREHGVPLERIAAREREPALGYDGPALLLPEVAQVRNPRLLRAMRQCLEGLGVVIHEQTEVIGWRIAGNAVQAVETTRGDFSAERYLVCGGAWSQILCGRYAQGLDIWPVRGQIVLFQATPGLLDTVVLRNGYYLVPRKDGLILAGTTRENVGFDKSTTAQARADILAHASALLPALREEMIVKHWAGLRPGAPDNIPTLGRHPEIENLYVNSGHFRYGVTMAPACAEIIANLLLGRPQPLDIAPYRWPQAAA